MQNILFFRLDTLGDQILFSGVLEAVQKHEPDCRISVLVQESFKYIAQLLSPRIHWLTTSIDPYSLPAVLTADFLSEFHRLHQQLLESEFDVVVSPLHNRVYLEDMLAQLCPASRKIALTGRYGYQPQYRDLWLQLGLKPGLAYTEWVRVEEWSHELEKNAALASYLLGKQVKIRPCLQVPAEAMEWARLQISALGLEGKKWIACWPTVGGTAQLKAWPLQYYRKLIQSLHRKGFRTLVLSSISEDDLSTAMIQELDREDPAWGRRILFTYDELARLAALITLCSVYIGNDTGPMHLAAALGRPVVAFFGGGHWPRFLPVGPRNSLLVKRMPCYRCEYDCLWGNVHCIKSIPFELVEEAALDALLNRTAETGTTLYSPGVGFGSLREAVRLVGPQLASATQRSLLRKKINKIVTYRLAGLLRTRIPKSRGDYSLAAWKTR